MSYLWHDRLIQLIFLIGLALSSFSCAARQDVPTRNDLSAMRQELLGQVTRTRSDLEAKMVRTQQDRQRQQEFTAFRTQLQNLQGQVEMLRENVAELSTKLQMKFQVIERALIAGLLIEQHELQERLKVMDKSLQELTPTSSSPKK